jgi:thiol-disulfide isomerase/thioredoxin
MKLSSSKLSWILVIALFLGFQFAANRNLVNGEPPALPNTTLEGQTFELAQLHGKPALIYFWAEWCPICRAMQSTVQAVARDYPLMSVAMQSGGKAEVAKYQREQNFQVPVVLDEDGEIAKRYGLRGVPAVFVLGPEGQIRFAATGYTSEIGLRLRLWWAGL